MFSFKNLIEKKQKKIYKIKRIQIYKKNERKTKKKTKLTKQKNKIKLKTGGKKGEKCNFFLIDKFWSVFLDCFSHFKKFY